MKKMIKSITLSFCLLLGLVGLSHAQEDQTPFDGPAINSHIKSVEVDQDNNQIKLVVELKNNTANFIDNLTSYLEIYKGEKLAEEGYLFNGLQFVDVLKKETQKLEPGLLTEVEMKFPFSNRLEEGKYFVRYVIQDREHENAGITYYPTPIIIKGEGGFVGSLNAYVEVAGKKSDPALGLRASRNDVFSIIVPMDENEGFRKVLQEGRIFAKVLVKSVADVEEETRSIPEREVSIIKNEEGKDVVRIDVKPWPEMATGPFNVYVIFTDENGQKITSNIFAKWFRSDDVARIKEIVTKTNYYKEGDNLDLNIKTTFFGLSDDRNFLITIKLKTDQGDLSFSSEKQINKGDTEAEFSFFDKILKKEVVVSSIEAILIDKETRERYDKMSLTLDGGKLYINGKTIKKKEMGAQEEDENGSGLLDTAIRFSLLVIVLAIIVILGMYFKKNNFKNKNLVFLLGLIGMGAIGVFLLVDKSDKVRADCAINDSFCADENSIGVVSPIYVWIDNDTSTLGNQYPSGSQGDCPVTRSVDIYARYACQNCLNGSPIVLGLEARYSDGTDDLNSCSAEGWAVPSHETAGSYGPFRVNIPLNSGSVSYRSLVRLGAGCACARAEKFSQWLSFSCSIPKTNPTAVIDTPSANPVSYTEGDNVNLIGHGVLGSGGGSINAYVWVDIDVSKTTTPSYLGTNCRCADGYDTNGDGTIDCADALALGATANDITVSNLSVGTHKVCLNVRQQYPDGTVSWAGSNVDFRDIIILPSPPIVDLKGSYGGISNTDGPLEVVPGNPFELNWTTTNATSCTASSPDSGWSGIKSVPTGSDGGITTYTGGNYILSCDGPGGNGVSDSVEVKLCSPAGYLCQQVSSTTNCSDLPANCGKENNITQSCLVTYYKSDGSVCGSRTENASVCDSNGVTCPNNLVEYCPPCDVESNWVEVTP